MEPIRFSGLSSGLDTQSIVDNLMKAESIPQENMKKAKQLLEWKRDDYREMNKKMSELNDDIFDGIGKQSSFIKKDVASTNENAVIAKNINSTMEVNTTIRVDQIAQTAYMNSSNRIATADFDPNAKLATQSGNLTDTTFTDSGRTHTFTIQAINEDGTLGDEETFTFNPVEDSLNDIIKEINKSNANVVAFYDEPTGKVSISAKNTGDVDGSAEIKLDGDFLTKTLLLDTDSKVASDNKNGREGSNAKFEFNGLLTERSNNTFRINGYEYTLKGVTDDGDEVTESGETVNISSKPDVDAIFEKIVKFVDKYNTTIETLNDEINEKRKYDYKPLSKEEKEAMSEDEVKNWEEAARAGMIYGDSTIRNALTQMRRDLYTPVEGTDGAYSQLYEIGITSSKRYQDNGRLEIDETTLKKAITENAVDVYKLFNTNTSSDEHGEIGIADRLDNTLKEAMRSIKDMAGSELSNNSQFSIGREIKDIDNDIYDEDTRLAKLKDSYWKKYSQLESAMARANSQISTLLGQL